MLTKKTQKKIGKQYSRSFSFTREAVDVEARTVELSFSSEEPAERWWGTEILEHNDGSVRLDRLLSSGPLLLDHNREKVIGKIEEVSIDTKARKSRALVRFGQSTLANEAFQDVQDEIRGSVSVGYLIHKTLEDVDKSEFRAIDWEPLEISLVSIPMDTTVGVGRSDEFTEHETIMEVRSMDPTEEEIEAQRVTDEEAAKKKVVVSARSVDVGAERDSAAKAERLRITRIAATGAKYGQKELANKHIQEGLSAEDFNQAVLDGMKSTPISPDSAEVGLDDKERKEFSFVRLIRAQAAMKGMPDFSKKHIEEAAFELECHDAVEKVRGTSQGLWVPYDVLRGTRRQQEIAQQRDLQVTIGTAGGNLVAEELLGASFIEILRNNMVTAQAGVTNMDGLQGDIAIPKQTGAATAFWVAEGGAPAESQQVIGQIALTPKTLAAFTDFTRKLMLQSVLDIEQFVRNDFARIVAIEMDRVVLYGLGAAGEPKGIEFWDGVNTTSFSTSQTPTWAEIVDQEGDVATDNALVGSLKYITHPTVRANLKTTSKAGTEAIFVMGEDGRLNGYETLVSTQVVNTDVWFGNWADAFVGRWGGVDVLVDPFTASTTGTIRIVIFQSADVAVRHGESFSLGR